LSELITYSSEVIMDDNSVNSTSSEGSGWRSVKPKVADLVYWKDPKKSGIAFGTGFVILLSLACCSVISVVAYTALLLLTGTLSFRIYKNVLQAVQKTNEGHPFKEYLDVDLAPNNDRVHQVVDSLLKHYNTLVRKLRGVFLVEDIVDSIKFVVLFWVLTYIGSWFNGLTLVILAYIAAFALPKAYEMNKAQVDQVLGLACTQIQDVISKVKAVIPFPSSANKEKSQ